MATYKYQSIDLSKDAIRLVQLHPGHYSDPVQCELFEAFLHETEGVPYEALSYVWGSTDNKAEVSINGQPAYVTRNLYYALRGLRDLNSHRILWIDALSIDQDNHKERGHQVGQMRFVYQKAWRVLIWLGRSDQDMDMFFDMANQLDQQIMARPRSEQNVTSVWDFEWRILQQRRLGMRGSSPTDLQKIMECLLARSWFERVWVIQEAASARIAAVLCGRKSVSSRTFVMLPSLTGVDCSGTVRSIMEVIPGPLRQLSRLHDQADLATLLVRFHTSKASDPRDKVFALLGISSDAKHREVFAPNYEISLTQVIANTISFLLFGKVTDCTPTHFPSWDIDSLVSVLHAPKPLAEAILSWALERSHARDTLLFLCKVVRPETIAFGVAKAKFHHDILGGLLDRGEVAVSLVGPSGTLLNVAATAGNSEVVSVLLKWNDIMVDWPGEDGKTPLWMASRAGHSRIVELLLVREADVEAADNISGRTPLWIAANNGYPEVVRLLLSHNANVEAADNTYGSTPLWIAAYNGYPEVVRLLLSRNADVEAADNISGRTPLWIAANNGDAAVVKLLLSRNADVEAADNTYGSTPLWIAAYNRYPEVVRLLLSYKADIQRIDKSIKQTPFFATLWSRHTAQVLAHAQDEGWQLHWEPMSKAYGRDVETGIKLANGTIPEVELREIATRLYPYGPKDERLLLTKVARPSFEGNDAHLATTIAVMSQLLHYGADINESSNGHTALEIAEMDGDIGLVEFLVDPPPSLLYKYPLPDRYGSFGMATTTPRPGLSGRLGLYFSQKPAMGELYDRCMSDLGRKPTLT